MSTPEWITPEDVLAYLDPLAPPGEAEDNLALATATVKAAVERRRSDLWTGDPPAFTPGDEVRGGAIMWAAIVYQSRSTGDGPAGFDPTTMFDSLGARRGEVMRMLGWRRPELA